MESAETGGMDAARAVVLETLQMAVCQDPNLLKRSEQKLKQWERTPGFNTILQSIFSNYEIDSNIRLLAVLCCKNGIDRYWRKAAPNALTEDEKSVLRSGLLMDMREPIPHLAKQKAVLIAKIARYDCPSEWPDLIVTLIDAVRSEDWLVRSRSLLILGQVIKNFSSKRLTGDRRAFKELSHNIFPLIRSVSDQHIHNFFMQYKTDVGEARSSLENALVSLRILDKLIVYGFKKPDEHTYVCEFLSSLINDQITATLRIRYEMAEERSRRPECGGELVNLCEKLASKQAKVLSNLLEFHPYSFVEVMRPALDLAYYAFRPELSPLLFERLLIQYLCLIKEIVLCSEYKPAPYNNITAENSVESGKAIEIKQKFFDEERVTDMCRKLVTHYFLLTQDELNLWQCDPETFATEEAGESWRYSLRPCLENLFLTVFHEYSNMLAPVLVELIRSNTEFVPPDSLFSILAKDAVYNAIGLAAFDLYEEVNFNDWFMTKLREELKVGGDNYRIIRRRIAWLLGRWTGVKLSYQLYPALYTAMIPLLSREEDLVVRLEAANTIKVVIDDFEFSSEHFLDYLQPVFQALFHLLQDVQECDTKMRVLWVLYFIVERVGASIEPHCESLLKYLPLLWAESESYNMLRCAIIVTLIGLVKVLGQMKVPNEIHDFILSIIVMSTDINQDSGFYLVEDGLGLWQVVLENTPQPTPEIMALFSKLPPLLAQNTEFLKPSLSIMQAYILLAPDEFLKSQGGVVVRICWEIYHDLDHIGTGAVLKLFELCIAANPRVSLPLLEPLLTAIFQSIVDGEVTRWILKTLYYSLLSRILLTSKQAFVQMVGRLSAMRMMSEDEVMNELVEDWLKHVPLIGMLGRKKLNALALTSLLTTNSKFVYDKFCGILLAVVEVINDLNRVDYNGQSVDSLVMSADFFDHEYETEHEMRKEKMAAADPVHSVPLDKYFKYQLNELESSVGGEKFREFVDTVDVETLDMVCTYVDIRAPTKESTNTDLIHLFTTQLGI